MCTKTKKKITFKQILDIIKLAVFLIIVIGVPIYLMFFNHNVIEMAGQYKNVVKYLQQRPEISIFLYIGIEILQVTISFLPGQVFQMAAGSVFGVFHGLILTCLGKLIGEVLAYYLAKLLGRDGIKMMIGETKMNKLMDAFNSEKAYVFTFLFYLIPGLPKDVLCFPAGISNMRFKAFIIISMVARMPALFGSIWFGDMYMKNDYVGMAVLTGVCTVLFILGVIFRKKLHTIVDEIYTKLSK